MNQRNIMKCFPGRTGKQILSTHRSLCEKRSARTERSEFAEQMMVNESLSQSKLHQSNYRTAAGEHTLVANCAERTI